jgi:hypothetical protein
MAADIAVLTVAEVEVSITPDIAVLAVAGVVVLIAVVVAVVLLIKGDPKPAPRTSTPRAQMAAPISSSRPGAPPPPKRAPSRNAAFRPGGRAKVIASGDSHHGQVGTIDPLYGDDDKYVFLKFPGDSETYAFRPNEVSAIQAQAQRAAVKSPTPATRSPAPNAISAKPVPATKVEPPGAKSTDAVAAKVDLPREKALTPVPTAPPPDSGNQEPTGSSPAPPAPVNNAVQKVGHYWSTLPLAGQIGIIAASVVAILVGVGVAVVPSGDSSRDQYSYDIGRGEIAEAKFISQQYGVTDVQEACRRAVKAGYAYELGVKEVSGQVDPEPDGVNLDDAIAGCVDAYK